MIGRTVLEIDSDRLDEMWSFQHDISNLFQQKAVPAMEQLFDQLVGADEVVRLDQVVVQLDPVDRRFLADEFVQNLLVALNETLSDRLANRLPMAAEAEPIRGDHNGTNTDQVPIAAEAEPIRRDRAGADWEVLLYFLEYGRLPWWRLTEDWQSWIARWEAVMEAGNFWQAPLRELLRVYPSARQRLVAQFSEGFLHQVVLQLQPTWLRWSDILTQARSLTQALRLSDRASQQLQTQAWLLLLADLAQNSSRDRPLPTNQWMRGWLTALIQTWIAESQLKMGSALRLDTPDMQSQKLPPAISTTDDGTPVPRPSDTQPGRVVDSRAIAYQRLHSLIESIPMAEKALWLAALDRVIPRPSRAFPLDSPPQQSTADRQTERRERADSAGDRDTSTPSSDVDLTAIGEDVEQARPLAELSQSDRDRTTPFSDFDLNAIGEDVEWASSSAEQGQLVVPTHTNTVSLGAGDSPLSPEEGAAGLFVNQAGLAILHPFLPAYFEEVGLLEGDVFRDRQTQETAIYLLHYLATGQVDAPEYELVLPKLLCGWQLNDPVTREPSLPDAALAEGEHLLQTVINYWEALKSTSPDGLREGFLQREGKLTQLYEGDWRLQVEQQAIDVLLGSLPWGFNVVKLPWMENLLMVEWS
jgi:hypothetical protein